MDKGCTILGSFAALPQVEIGRLSVDGNAVIMAFTDGLTDLRDPSGQFLDEAMLHHFARANYLLPPMEFNRLLLEQIERFKGNQSYPDDFTLLTCRVFGG